MLAELYKTNAHACTHTHTHTLTHKCTYIRKYFFFVEGEIWDISRGDLQGRWNPQKVPLGIFPPLTPSLGDGVCGGMVFRGTFSWFKPSPRDVVAHNHFNHSSFTPPLLPKSALTPPTN